jgi:hypothetical protein
VTTDEGPVAKALEASLTTAPTLPRDVAAVELARHYAGLIDEAVPLAKYDEPLKALRRAVTECSDPNAGKHLAKIEAALSAHSVMSDLGPKLLATLTALGMTAAGRSAKGGAPDGPRVPDELAKLRAERGTG